MGHLAAAYSSFICDHLMVALSGALSWFIKAPDFLKGQPILSVNEVGISVAWFAFQEKGYLSVVE